MVNQRCSQCLRSTRLFGYCVGCLGPPTIPSEPVAAWYIGVLATRPVASLSDADVKLIQMAACGNITQAHHDRRAADEAPPTRPAHSGGYVGVQGERTTLVVRCVSVTNIGTSEKYQERGPRFVIVFREESSGHLVTWFTGEGTKFDPRPDGVYTITAMVKSHEPYNGECQTLINRPTLKEEKRDSADGSG